MIFLYVEKRKIPVQLIEYVKQKKLDIKIKELDIVTRDILKMYDIEKFPALVNWTRKYTYSFGDNVMEYLKNNGNKF